MTESRAIRVERYAEIGGVIRRDAGTLISRWAMRAVQSQPNAARVHHDVLLDHLPNFLEELATHLETEGVPDHSSHCKTADQHGTQRWQTGWSLSEVVRDYRILRLVILEHLDETLNRPLRLRETMAVGLALDDAIEVSVESYTTSREGQLRQLEDSVRSQANALRAADRRKDNFLATLAHELRNPLAPLRNALEVLRLGGDSGVAIQQVRELMERQVGHLTRLVDDLLDVSRIASDKLVLQRKQLDLCTLLDQALQMNAPLRTTRRHEVVLDLPAEGLWVDADPARLLQVFVNLLNNAAKYTPPGGRISITAGRKGNEVVVYVRDTGVGIPADMLPHIFELFTQLDLDGERTQGGLGIGLTLVRRLVELHRGTIAASSDGAGRGSEFVVRLPAAGVPEKPAQRIASSSTVPSRHILIVEDNADGRETLAMLLRLLGHRVEVAADGPTGLERALAVRPEVALIDIGLPGMNGYQVAIELRSAFGAAIRLVALTGHSQPEDRQRAFEAGFDAHIVKPVDLEPLQHLLGELVKTSGT